MKYTTIKWEEDTGTPGAICAYAVLRFGSSKVGRSVSIEKVGGKYQVTYVQTEGFQYRTSTAVSDTMAKAKNAGVNFLTPNDAKPWVMSKRRA